jgi:hypothetical protein
MNHKGHKGHKAESRRHSALKKHSKAFFVVLVVPGSFALAHLQFFEHARFAVLVDAAW